MRNHLLYIILGYYKVAATNADRVYNPWNPEPHDPHTWVLPSTTAP